MPAVIDRGESFDWHREWVVNNALWSLERVANQDRGMLCRIRTELLDGTIDRPRMVSVSHHEARSSRRLILRQAQEERWKTTTNPLIVNTL